jgi:CubicO group peptidase (beta-lactamase class C family)
MASQALGLGAPAIQSQSVDDYLAQEMKAQHIPGLALGVYRNGEIVKAQGYGLANVELNVPVKPETIFQSGSVGKQFAATAVMMLVEEGKVGLDDAITKYFPGAPDAWNNIKVRNLLSHTSGLAEYESDERTGPSGPFYLRLDFTEDELLKKAEALPFDFQPGEKWSYRNTNYLLLGFLIRKVTGEFYGDYLQERIFKPLGMNATRIISEADIIPNRAAGYQLVKGELKNQDWVSPTFNSTADGALYFTVLDLAKWDAALCTEKLVKKSSLDQMWTVAKLNDGKPNKSNYGFAWTIDQMNGHRVIEHGGAWQGFTTYIARYVDDKLTVVVLTNLDSAHSNPGRIAHHVAGLYVPALMPPELKPIEDKEPQVTAFFREVLQKIAEGKADPEWFTPDRRKELFPDRIKALGEFVKSLGALKSLDLVERKEEDGLPAYTYRAAFSDRTMLLRLTLSPDGKIAGMRLVSE